MYIKPKGEETMKKTLAIMLALIMVLALVPTVALAEGSAIYVSSTGDDANNGLSATTPLATLAKAVDMAEDGATIYVMSDLTMTKCARFYDKSLTITSLGETAFTVTRGDSFDTLDDPARKEYNPAMIEVQTNTPGGKSAGLTLTNIVFDDAGIHAGTVFAQAVSDDGTGTFDTTNNKNCVQDAIIASNATIPSTIKLGEGAILRNFGGMSAVRITSAATLVMKSGSVIEDTTITTRGNDTDASNAAQGPAGAVWLQGGSFNMESGAKIKDIKGRAVYVDGGEVTVGGTISGIIGNVNMWQCTKTTNGIKIDGSAIHLRNSNASATLTSTAVIEKISGGGNAIYVTGNGNKIKAEQQSVIKDLTNTTGIYCGSSSEAQLSGEITNLKGGNALSVNDGAKAVLEAEGSICNNECATAVVYLRGGALFTIKGKINNNTSSGNCAALFIVTNGGNSHATLEDGGEICNNINNGSKYGAAVELQQGECSFTMNGGKITGNNGPLGAIQVHKESAKLIMNGGEVTENTSSTTDGEAGIYVENGKPTAELNGGKAQSITLAKDVSAEIGKGNIYISDRFDLESGHVAMIQDSKTVTPAPGSFDIKLGNASTNAVTALKAASTAKGWSEEPIATFWTQRDNAATMTVGGITITDSSMPVYALVQATDANGKPDSNAEVKVYATKVEESSVTFTIPGTGNNGCAVALVQPRQDFGNVVITGPAEIKEDPAATTYEIPYRATYTMSRSFISTLKTLAQNLAGDNGTGIELKFVVQLDNRLTAKKDAAGKFIYKFDGAGVLETDESGIAVSGDSHTITVPCKLKNGWQNAIKDNIVMTLDGTGVLQAKDFNPGGVLGTTGNIQAILPIQGEIINVLIPANVCQTKMVGSTPTPPPSADPSPTPGGGNGGGYYYPTTTPVPVIVIPPKTGDMTVWQSILHFLGIK